MKVYTNYDFRHMDKRPVLMALTQGTGAGLFQPRATSALGYFTSTQGNKRPGLLYFNPPGCYHHTRATGALGYFTSTLRVVIIPDIK